ncbi:signal recognition particle-docking protein FtsY [Corynebacterium halotolerans]|uniref:signal recognition particle-docking protein FtsY n=1 Tax=Corynebacterium halotolerans TaxID=225326 RepID=UPI003CF55C72
MISNTALIIGIVVVVLLLLIILVVVGLMRRKSKTVSFEKPKDEEPKELTQQEKSGNYQAQGGFNFAPAKPAEKEPELRVDQTLKPDQPPKQAPSVPPVTPAQPATPSVAADTSGKDSEQLQRDTAPPKRGEGTPSQGNAADAAAAVKGDELAEGTGTAQSPADSTGDVAAPAAGAARGTGEPDARGQDVAQTPDETGDTSLESEALEGDYAAAEKTASQDHYRVVEETAPGAPTEQAPDELDDAAEQPGGPQPEATANYQVVEDTEDEKPQEQSAAPAGAAVEETPAAGQPSADQAQPADTAAELTEPVEHTAPDAGTAATAGTAAAAASAARETGTEPELAEGEHDTRAETPDVPAQEEATGEPDVDTEDVAAEDVAAAEEAAEAAQVTAEGAEAAREQTPVPDTPAEPAPEPMEEIAPAAGRLGRLRGRLSRSQNVIGQGVLGILTAGDLDEDAWEEIEDTLIMADLGTTVTMKVVDSLRDKIAERGVTSEDDARAMLRETLVEAARPELDRSIKAMPYEGKPAVVLVVGVNGTGKTTTTGKLARVLVSMGHKVLLGAADTFRAAAADQLETWGNRVGATTVRGAEGADPASVAFDAVARGVEEQADVVLIDTAGRLHTSTPLMDQLGKVKRVVEKKTDVDEVLLVLDATVGQNGLLQARTFREVVDITGVVLTKLDGTAKGGIVFQVQEELGVPVKLVGLGEGADHLAPFEVEGFVDALLG